MSSGRRSKPAHTSGGTLKTPAHLHDTYKIPEFLPSRKISRCWYGYALSDKKEFLSVIQTLEAAGAIPQMGSPAKDVQRVPQTMLSGMAGETRSTFTKHVSRYSRWGDGCKNCLPAGKDQKHWPCRCGCHTTNPNWPADRRRRKSEQMREMAASHPHWRGHDERGNIANIEKSETVADGGKIDAFRSDSPVTRTGRGHSKAIWDSSGISHSTSRAGAFRDGEFTQAPELASPRSNGETSCADSSVCEAGQSVPAPSFSRRHVACIITKNPGWSSANTYALAMPEDVRPIVEAGADPLPILAKYFGARVFDIEMAKFLGYNLNGYRKTYGWIWHANLPDAPDCSCLAGQKRLAFQTKCPKCDGRGYTITSPAIGNGPGMPPNGRLILHWLLDRGIDEEHRYCGRCQRTFHKPACPGCGDRGQVTKKRGELKKYTQEQIGQALGMDVSTIRRYFRAFRRLNLVRTLMGKVYRHCSKCDKTYTGTCSCGNRGGTVKSRDPHTIYWLPSRTLDKEIAATERERLKALVQFHRHFLEKAQLHNMEQAVELCQRVLAEREGWEHQLQSFWHEMRRRLTANHSLARFTNVLFPQKE